MPAVGVGQTCAIGAVCETNQHEALARKQRHGYYLTVSDRQDHDALQHPTFPLLRDRVCMTYPCSARARSYAPVENVSTRSQLLIVHFVRGVRRSRIFCFLFTRASAAACRLYLNIRFDIWRYPSWVCCFSGRGWLARLWSPISRYGRAYGRLKRAGKLARISRVLLAPSFPLDAILFSHNLARWRRAGAVVAPVRLGSLLAILLAAILWRCRRCLPHENVSIRAMVSP